MRHSINATYNHTREVQPSNTVCMLCQLCMYPVCNIEGNNAWHASLSGNHLHVLATLLVAVPGCLQM